MKMMMMQNGDNESSCKDATAKHATMLPQTCHTFCGVLDPNLFSLGKKKDPNMLAILFIIPIVIAIKIKGGLQCKSLTVDACLVTRHFPFFLLPGSELLDWMLMLLIYKRFIYVSFTAPLSLPPLFGIKFQSEKSCVKLRLCKSYLCEILHNFFIWKIVVSNLA